MKRRVFDIECNGLYQEATHMWCLVFKNLDTLEVSKYPPQGIDEGLKELFSSDVIVGHNIAGFDLPVIEKLKGLKYTGVVRDTLCMSRLFKPERFFHSLDSYGKQFKRYKPAHEDWSKYSPDMLHRCSEDVEINHLVYDWLLKDEREWDWIDALELEQEFSRDQTLQETIGVKINLRGLKKLVQQIDIGVAKIDAKLDPIMPLNVKAKGAEVKKIFKKDGDYTQQVVRWFNEDGNSEYFLQRNRL